MLPASCAMTAAVGSWYDYPQYFDLAFRSETKAEADFIEAACRKYALGRVRRLLEPACGSGRLVAELARRGYRLTGYDLSLPMLRYARARLARRGLTARLMHGDMASFRPAHAVDAAFNTFNSFRHLLSEEAARGHLAHVAASVRSGGIFILGLHLVPLHAAEESCERWTVHRGRMSLTATLRVVDFDRRRRIERLRISLLVRTPRRTRRLRSEFPLRLYTASQLARLIASVPQWELCDVFDFWYEIERPRRLDNEMSDTVLVLRRK
jgi:SAM-dependent methyltransferase